MDSLVKNETLINAYQYLLGTGVVKNQRDVCRMTGLGYDAVQKVLNNKRTATDEFRKKFEKELLTPLKLRLSQFNKIDYKKLEEVDEYTFKEFVVSKITRIELLIRHSTIAILSNVGGMSTENVNDAWQQIEGAAREDLKNMKDSITDI